MSCIQVAPDYTAWILTSQIMTVMVLLTATFRCLQVLHAFDLPGTPTIFPSRVGE